MNKFKLVAGVGLVFLVGILSGVIGSGIYYEVRLKYFAAGGPPMDARIRMVLDRFSDDLQLTESQKVEIEKILRDVQDRVFELRRETFPEIEKLNEEGLERIREKLDSTQRKKFNRFHNKLKIMHDTLAVKLDLPGGPPAPDIGEIKHLLNLTPDQALEIEKIMDEGNIEREKIMEDHRGRQPSDFSQIRQKITESENMQYEMIKKILTPDQLEIYRKHIEERRLRRPPGLPPTPSGGLPPTPRW